MKNINYLIISVCLSVFAAGCAQKQVSAPASAQTRESRSQSQISERSLDDANTMSRPVVIPETPKPIVIPGTETVVRQTENKAQNMALPSIDYVTDRMFEYGRKLDRWKELDKQSVVENLNQQQTEAMVRCFRDLQKVLNGYGRLHDDLLNRNIISESAMFDANEAMELQKMDIAFLESVCGRLLGGSEDKAVGWQERNQDADLNQIETLIERYSSSKEYDEVVKVWLQIPAFQVERVDLRTKILYGNALIYLGQQEKAAEIFQQIIDEMSVSQDEPMDVLSLRKKLADLYTASGNYLAAEGQYDQISNDYVTIGKIDEWSKLQLSILERSKTGSPELTEYSNLLREYLAFYPAKDGYRIVRQAEKFLQDYPYTPVASNVDIIRENAQKRADEWFNSFLAQVDALAKEKKYQDAMELLQTIPEDIIGPEKVLEVKSKTDELVLAEAVERETMNLERRQELQRRWNEGMVLADQGDYDGAIKIFTELLDTEYSAKAELKIADLSMQAAKDDRRKAADLFIRFTKTPDIESKKKLLVESRRVLKDILVKYPEVDIAEKVMGNISRVEKEMNDLDPLLLPMTEQEEREKIMDQAVEPKLPAQMDVDAFDMPVTPSASTPLEPAPSSQPVLPPLPVQQYRPGN